MIIVQKYGGKTISDSSKIKEIAQKIHALHKQSHKLIIVVSAMGSTTDELMSLARQITDKPTARELDMLLSTGERVSMALMSMALHDLGCPAISFTGSQAGVMTTGPHSDANILEVKPVRLEEELQKDKVVVLAGFQGVDPNTKEITTLGRGGSDTTAIAMAEYFKADRCEILKDVNGVMTADPNTDAGAQVIPKLSTSELLEMCRYGCKVLHHKAAQLAIDLKQALHIRHWTQQTPGTEVVPTDTPVVIPYTMSEQTYCIEVSLRADNLEKGRQQFKNLISRLKIPEPLILDEFHKTYRARFIIASHKGYQESLLSDLTSNLLDKPKPLTAVTYLSHQKEFSEHDQELITRGLRVHYKSLNPTRISLYREVKR